MFRTKAVVTSILLILGSMQLLGCSIIGLTGGQQYDAREPDEYLFLPSQADSIKQNVFVEVLMRDSAITTGYYTGRKGTSTSDTLFLMNSGDTVLIPADQILTIRQPVRKGAATIGFMLGLALDVGAVAAIVVSTNALKGK